MSRLLTALRAAGEATRLRILSILDGNELTVSEITEALGQSQPRVSRHLKLLVEAGLLRRHQEGSWVFYGLADSGDMVAIINGLVNLIDPNDEIHGEDRHRITQIREANARRAARYFEKNAAEWDRIRRHTVADATVEDRLVEHIRNETVGLLLDIGTGTGRILEVLSPYVERGLGLDSSREMRVIARSNLARAGIRNCRVEDDDIHRLERPDGFADVVTIHQVLHYLDHPDVAVAEAARVLTPGGSLLVVDFMPHDLEFLRERHAHRRLGFSNDTVGQWCDRSGLIMTRHVALPANKPEASETLTVGLWIMHKPAN